MWFIYVAVGLVLLIGCRIYVGRRLTSALVHFGASERRARIARWALTWLMFGFPVVMFVTVLVSLALGLASFPRYDGKPGAWLLGYPFAWAVLVVVQSMPWLVVNDIIYALTKRARIRSIGVLAVIGAFALYTPIRVIAERGDVRIRHHVVGTGASSFRIAFIADVQHDAFTDAARARGIYDLVNAEQPDIVLSGGDWINAGPDYIEEAAEAASRLTSRLGTFSVHGDHEHFAYIDRERSVGEVERAMRARGIAMIDNETRRFPHAGKQVSVIFLNYNYIRRADDTTIARLLADVANADYSILVTHQLDRHLASLVKDNVDLVLAGHTHGGQFNPVLGVTHVRLARLETEHVDGRYQLGARTTVIVTAGIGYSVVPLRYASPGSLEVISLSL